MYKCPYCGEEIKNMYSIFVEHDYRVYFDLDCIKCGKKFEVDVEPIPDFIFSKKKLDEIKKGEKK